METLEYSIIVPAFNEGQMISGCLRSLLHVMECVSAPGELIVVDNNSTDDTAKIAESLGARVVFEEHRQIARARNAGAKNARGKFLFFVDADTQISPELFMGALARLKTDKVVGGGARVEFDTVPSFWGKVLLRFWLTISKVAKFAAGCFVFCRCEAFFAVGGFDEKVFASEELGLSRRLRLFGRKNRRRFEIIDMPGIKTSGRKNKETLMVFLTIVVFMLFPAAVRFRSLCFLWYSCRK